MSRTKIEWSDETWPIVTGCTPCSIGCANCYAARMAATRLKHHPRYEGLATIENGKARWTGEVRLNHDVLEQPLRWRKPRRIFVASMGDLFHRDVDEDFLIDIFVRMGEAPQHTFQILTKRPVRMYEFISKSTWGMSPLSNVWLGANIENQATADERTLWLLQTPAAVRFVSVEPMLGAVYLKPWLSKPFIQIATEDEKWNRQLDWVICGGESGPGARPMHPDWARSLRDQCQAAGVPFFFKQWGAHLGVDYMGNTSIWTRADGLSGQVGKRPEIDFGDGHGAVRIGKKAAGHLLDGRTWDEMPKGE